MTVGTQDLVEVWRDELKEHRGSYYVTYQPADSRWNVATIDLVFYGGIPDFKVIRPAMEEEMRLWLKRFKVPVMVSSFDCKGSFIHLPKTEGNSNLMAHIDPDTDEIISRWGLFQNEELPQGHMTPAHLNQVYQNLPFRYAKDVRGSADQQHRQLRIGIRVIRVFFFLVIAFPLAIELISLGFEWLGTLLQAISILGGLYKIAKHLGWIKEPRSARDEAEKCRRMEHYFYHCERNPAGFERLKAENFDRESALSIHREAAAIEACSNNQIISHGPK